MKIDIRAFNGASPVKNHSERPLRGHAWIEMFERASRRVSGVREQRQSLDFALLVQIFEAGLVEIGFAADFKDSWRDAPELMRHRFDGLDVLGDVVANGAISARSRVFEFTVFVHDRDGHAVDFRLDHDWNFFIRQEFGDSFVEIADLFFGVSVVQAEHWNAVPNLSERLK